MVAADSCATSSRGDAPRPGLLPALVRTNNPVGSALIPRRPADPGSGGFCVRVARTSGRWEASALSALSAAVARADNADKADNGMRVGLCVNHRQQDHWPRPSSRRNTVGCWCGAATNRQIVKAGLFYSYPVRTPMLQIAERTHWRPNTSTSNRLRLTRLPARLA